MILIMPADFDPTPARSRSALYQYWVRQSGETLSVMSCSCRGDWSQCQLHARKLIDAETRALTVKLLNYRCPLSSLVSNLTEVSVIIVNSF